MSILFKPPWNKSIIIDADLFMIIKNKIEDFFGLYIEKRWVTHTNNNKIILDRYYITTRQDFLPIFQKYMSNTNIL